MKWAKSLPLAVMSSSCLAASIDVDSLIEMPLESLMKMDIEVTSQAKREQRSFDTSAAIFVITAEDIKRIGISTIPDALRMVPGVQVGQVSSSEWAVGIRGLGGVFSQHLQVLVNGRSVFSNLFSSVLWDELNIAMRDIERIEVQRGPGSSVWGANAVNGVINIVTREPEAQEGSELALMAGSYENSVYGGTSQSTGETIHWRVSAYAQRRDGLYNSAETLQEGEASSERVAFALTHQGSRARFEVNVDLFQIDNEPYYLDTRDEVVAMNQGSVSYKNHEDKNGYVAQLLNRYDLQKNQSIRTRISIENIDRDSEYYIWEDENYDLDIEYVAELGTHYLTLGTNNRKTKSTIENGGRAQFTLEPESAEIDINSLFLHDSYSLNEKWQIDFGVRYENQRQSGDNFQGTLRGLWKLHPKHRFWAALSKADSTPSRLSSSRTESSIFVFPGSPPSTITILSEGGGLENAQLIAFEMGYKYQMGSSLSLNLTGFYNEYKNTVSSELSGFDVIEPVSGFPLVKVEARLGDNRDLISTGAEVTVNWQVARAWNLQYNASYLNFKDEIIGNLGATTGLTPATFYMSIDSPQHQHSLRLLGELNRRWSLGLWLRYMDELSLVEVDAYTLLDTKLTYSPNKELTLSLIAKNLGDDRHLEGTRGFYYVDDFEVERSLVAELEWIF